MIEHLGDNSAHAGILESIVMRPDPASTKWIVTQPRSPMRRRDPLATSHIAKGPTDTWRSFINRSNSIPTPYLGELDDSTHVTYQIRRWVGHRDEYATPEPGEKEGTAPWTTQPLS
jgi:hypothetical protein